MEQGVGMIQVSYITIKIKLLKNIGDHKSFDDQSKPAQTTVSLMEKVPFQIGSYICHYYDQTLICNQIIPN